jgi:flagellar secretion chaperone FliS
MSASSPYSKQQYLEQQILSANPEQLLLMLFDGAIKFCRTARKALDSKDYQGVHTNLVKAQKILTELMASLQMEEGNEVTLNLFKLYEYYHYQLVQANLKKSVAPIDEVISHLVDLRKTWAEAILVAKKEQRLSVTPGSPQHA